MKSLFRTFKKIWQIMPSALIINLVKIMPNSIMRYIGPMQVTIEPTNLCNLNCRLCPRTKLTRPVGSMSFENFENIVDDLPKLTRVMDLYFMGEPLLAPDIFKMMTYATDRGIKVRISSNAIYLKKYTNEILQSNLTEIIVAVDGATKETYAAYRKGGSFEDVISNIKYFIDERKQRHLKFPIVTFQMVVFRHNEHEIDKVISLAKELGVDHLILKRASLIGKIDEKEKMKAEFLPKSEKYVRDIYKSRKISHCWWAFNSVITQNGKITVCCYDWNGNYARGDVFGDGFKNTYRSDENTKLRKKALAQELSICNDCDYNNSATEVIF